jgi:hypothetical protein
LVEEIRFKAGAKRSPSGVSLNGLILDHSAHCGSSFRLFRKDNGDQGSPRDDGRITDISPAFTTKNGTSL